MTFRDIFDAFGGPTKLAEVIGVKPFHAQTMKTRGSIPLAYWPALIKAAEERGIQGVTYESLTMMAANRKGPASHHPFREAVSA